MARNGLEVVVSIKDTDIFKEILKVISGTLHDERISAEVRKDIEKRIESIIEAYEAAPGEKTINEARKEYGLNPINEESADQYLIRNNLS